MYLRACLFLLLSLWIPVAAAEGENDEAKEEYVGYVELKPFVANYGESTELHFVKCEITIQAGSIETEQALGDHLSAIRNDILYLLMAQSEESMSSVSAQKILAKKAILLVKQRLADEEDSEEAAKVTDLFFVSFVAQ
jgi:flagellar FliL protein